MRRQAAQGATSGATVEFKVHFRAGQRGRRRLRQGSRSKTPSVSDGRVPRISRLMALAIHCDELIRHGIVRDYADLARLGCVSRARVSQVMDLLNLAPDIQEEILLLTRSLGGNEVSERAARIVSKSLDWGSQRESWRGLLSRFDSA